MISFKNDYSEGACPQIMQVLLETNERQSDGYGLDSYCEEARGSIKKKLGCGNGDVHFFAGGTQANQTIIASVLRPYEAVIAVDSGHINVHETGAIEATGHKVLTAPGKAGKVLPQEVQQIVDAHTDEHMVKPAMVYISNATEIGTVYTLAELQALRQVCDRNGLVLFMDGARLGAAMCAADNDLKWTDYAKLVDVMYIGGTKNGALFGEACIIMNDALKKDFRYHIKQRGGMLAKGRLLGIQFQCLMQDGLLEKLADHAVAQAQKLQAGIKNKGYSFFIETTTNQIFPIMDNTTMEKMSESFAFQTWEAVDETHTAVRLVTSWATKPEAVEAFLDALPEAGK